MPYHSRYIAAALCQCGVPLSAKTVLIKLASHLGHGVVQCATLDHSQARLASASRCLGMRYWEITTMVTSAMTKNQAATRLETCSTAQTIRWECAYSVSLTHRGSQSASAILGLSIMLHRHAMSTFLNVLQTLQFATFMHISSNVALRLFLPGFSLCVGWSVKMTVYDLLFCHQEAEVYGCLIVELCLVTAPLLEH